MSVVIKCDSCGRISDPPYSHWDSPALVPDDWDECPTDERFDWCPWCIVRYGVKTEADFPNVSFPAPNQIVVHHVKNQDQWEMARAILGIDKSKKKKPV